MMKCMFFAVMMVGCFASPAFAKFALLVGVSQYEHPRLNDPQLKFPEDDARAIAELLKASGYEVQILVGKQATRQAIRTALAQVARQGNSDDVLVLGFFGHGVQYGESAYFCPYDTDLHVVKDAAGNALRDDAGVLRQEPDPAKMVSMRDMLDTLTVSKVGSKLLLADCCRADPSTARGGLLGRAFGEGLQVNQLPVNSAALFACSAGQQAYEHVEWKHGAFTRAFLDVCQTHAEVTANELSALLYRRVNELISAKRSMGGQERQTVSNVTRDVVDLKLDRNRKLQITLPETYNNSLGATMRLIPAGEFMMGSSLTPQQIDAKYPGGKPEYYEGEQPRHRVTISKPFYMGIHEVTVGQFRQFVAATGHKTEAETDGKGGYGFDTEEGTVRQAAEFTWRNPGFSQSDSEPVVNVSWNDAVAFCKWLSQRDDRTYRLPTEAEWEYACRAGSESEFHFGDDAEELTKYGNVADATAEAKYGWSGTTSSGDGFVTTAPVGTFRPNRFGLYDMHGNVWEWCNDWYSSYTAGAAIGPVGPGDGVARVYRGGSWDGSSRSCRSAFRSRFTPDYRNVQPGLPPSFRQPVGPASGA